MGKFSKKSQTKRTEPVFRLPKNRNKTTVKRIITAAEKQKKSQTTRPIYKLRRYYDALQRKRDGTHSEYDNYLIPQVENYLSGKPYDKEFINELLFKPEVNPNGPDDRTATIRTRATRRLPAKQIGEEEEEPLIPLTPTELLGEKKMRNMLNWIKTVKEKAQFTAPPTRGGRRRTQKRKKRKTNRKHKQTKHL